MNPVFDRLTRSYETARISRRNLLLTVPALMAAPRVMPQVTNPQIRLRKLNHFRLNVSNVQRSVEFYQGLFGMPIQARQGGTVCLRIGAGPQFLALVPAGSNPPSIANHVGLTVEDFNVDRIVSDLTARGFTKSDPGGASGLPVEPMKVRVIPRGPQAGGANEGTPEVFFGDADGLVVQLQDTAYCGGSGGRGNVCAAVEPSPKKGLLALKDL